MADQEPVPDEAKVVCTSRQLIPIFTYLMRLYAEAKDLDTEQMRRVTLEDVFLTLTEPA